MCIRDSAIEDKFLSCISGSDRQAVLDLISRVRKGDCASGSLKLHFTRPDIQKDIVLSLNAYLISEQDSSQRFITVSYTHLDVHGSGLPGSVRAQEAVYLAVFHPEA